MRNLSRRDFLKLSGLGLAALFTPSGAVEALSVAEFDNDKAKLKLPEWHSPDEETQKFLRENPINHGDLSKPEITISYDDQPDNPENFIKLLDDLKAANMRVTFFFLGAWIQAVLDGHFMGEGWGMTDPYEGDKFVNTRKVFERILADGHELGIHGWQHADEERAWMYGKDEVIAYMQQMKQKDLERQMIKSLLAMQEMCPTARVRYFRAPGGLEGWNPDQAAMVLAVGARCGMQHGGWNLETNGVDPETAAIVLSGIDDIGNGTIAVAHMFREQDQKSVLEIGRGLQVRGLSAVPMCESVAWDQTLESLNYRDSAPRHPV